MPEVDNDGVGSGVEVEEVAEGDSGQVHRAMVVEEGTGDPSVDREEVEEDSAVIEVAVEEDREVDGNTEVEATVEDEETLSIRFRIGDYIVVTSSYSPLITTPAFLYDLMHHSPGSKMDSTALIEIGMRGSAGKLIFAKNQLTEPL